MKKNVERACLCVLAAVVVSTEFSEVVSTELMERSRAMREGRERRLAAQRQQAPIEQLPQPVVQIQAQPAIGGMLLNPQAIHPRPQAVINFPAPPVMVAQPAPQPVRSEFSMMERSRAMMEGRERRLAAQRQQAPIEQLPQPVVQIQAQPAIGGMLLNPQAIQLWLPRPYVAGSPVNVNEISEQWENEYQRHRQTARANLDRLLQVKRDFLQKNVVEKLEAAGCVLPQSVKDCIRQNTHYKAPDVRAIYKFFTEGDGIAAFFDAPQLNALVGRLMHLNGGSRSEIIRNYISNEVLSSFLLPKLEPGMGVENIGEIMDANAGEIRRIMAGATAQNVFDLINDAIGKYNKFEEEFEKYLCDIHSSMWEYARQEFKPSDITKTLGALVEDSFLCLSFGHSPWMLGNKPVEATAGGNLAPGLRFLSKMFRVGGAEYFNREDIFWDTFFKEEYSEDDATVRMAVSSGEFLDFGVRYEDLKKAFEYVRERDKKDFIRNFAFDYYDYLYDNSLFRQEGWNRANEAEGIVLTPFPIPNIEERYNQEIARRRSVDEVAFRRNAGFDQLGLSNRVSYFPGFGSVGSENYNQQMDRMLLELFSFILTPDGGQFEVLTADGIIRRFEGARYYRIAKNSETGEYSVIYRRDATGCFCTDNDGFGRRRTLASDLWLDAMFQIEDDDTNGSLAAYVGSMPDSFRVASLKGLFENLRKTLSGEGDGRASPYHCDNGGIDAGLSWRTYFCNAAGSLNIIFNTLKENLPAIGAVVNENWIEKRTICAAALGHIGTGCFNCEGGIGTASDLALTAVIERYSPLNGFFFRRTFENFNFTFEYLDYRGREIGESSMAKQGALYMLNGLFGLPTKVSNDHITSNLAGMHRFIYGQGNRPGRRDIAERLALSDDEKALMYSGGSLGEAQTVNLVKKIMNAEMRSDLFIDRMVADRSFSTVAKVFLREVYRVEEVGNLGRITLPEDAASVRGRRMRLEDANKKALKQLAFMMLRHIETH